MTPDQLSAIRERLDAATPGPWEAGTASCCPDMGWVDGPKGAVCPQFTATRVTHSLDANDAELIANAPTDLRALLDEVERLTADRDANAAKLNAAFTEGTLAAGDAMRPQIAAAFARGAEAMRTALLQRVSWGSDLADRIRGEPVPEDK